MEEMLRAKRIESSTKYRTLVNYLKEIIGKETFINSEEIKKILKALEEID